MNKCKNCQSVLPDRILGKRGRNQIYCNQYCGHLFRGEIKFLDKPSNCAYCFKPLVHVGAGNPKRYCSRKHAGQFRQANKPKAPIVKKICEWCSKTFTTNLPNMKFCSIECRFAALYDKRVKATQVQRGANPRRFDFDCNRCGQLVTSDVFITKGKYGRFCRNCALVRRRERYRVKTAKRQNVMSPLRISADVLIERDGNLCHLCNQEIDLSLARNSRFGATIDHVIPLSKGGVDELDNLKLAHWICNIKKGNRLDA